MGPRYGYEVVCSPDDGGYYVEIIDYKTGKTISQSRVYRSRAIATAAAIQARADLLLSEVPRV